jgi:hypothetical protein
MREVELGRVRASAAGGGGRDYGDRRNSASVPVSPEKRTLEKRSV